MSNLRAALVVGVALISAAIFPEPAAANPLPVWEIEDTDNRVLLMGSIHMLRESDYPLPDGLLHALETSDTLVMEVDANALDAAGTQQILMDMGTSGDRTLREALGPEAYREAEQLAGEIGVSLTLFNQFEPWLAALTISQLRMMQLGFDPTRGIEMQFAARAMQTGKPTAGLETVEEQLRFMADMDEQTQREMLLQTLTEAVDLEEMISGIVSAWRVGDTVALEKLLLEGFADLPELRKAILVRRNRNWVAQILEMTDRESDYLVVVGAMHLIGDDSVVEMLEAEGLRVRQLNSADLQ